jgi:hypothetical protein
VTLTDALDAVGNRLSLASTLAGITGPSNTFDNNDRLSDVYDANGNTKTSSSVHYSYDFEDRLLSTSLGLTFVYYGDGNRVARTEGGGTTRFLEDDLTPTWYAQVTEEVANGPVVAKYAYGLMATSTPSRSDELSTAMTEVGQSGS